MPKDVMCQRACRPPLRQSNFRDRVYGKTSVPTARSVEHSEIRSCSTPAERTRKPSRTVLPIFRRRKPEVRPWGVRVKSPAQLAHQWRCRRPPSLEYIPSLGATTRTCSFPCFGCTGRRLRPWLRRVAPVRMSARTTLGPDAPAGHHGRDSAMRAKRALDSGPAAETVMTETLSTKSKSGASDRIGTERG